MLLLSSCYNDKIQELYPSTPTTTCDTNTVTYSATILPIIKASCSISGCHDATTVAGGYNYSTYAGLYVNVQNNRLMGALNHTTGYFAMPLNAPALTSCQISQFTAWINKGAPNN